MATLEKWFDPKAAQIKDPSKALEALRASRTPALVEVEMLQAGSTVASTAPGAGQHPQANMRFSQSAGGYAPDTPDLSDEQREAAEAYRQVERSILDRIAAEHLREQREAFGLLGAPPA